MVAEVFGIEGLVGAFFAGLGLNRLVPNRSPLMERTEFFGSALLVPLFLISVGLIIEPSVVVDPVTLGVAAALVAACLGGKAIAAALTRPLFGFSWAETGTVFSLTSPQAAATLAATVVGFELGLLNEVVVNAVLVLIVVSLLASAAAAEVFAARVPSAAADAGQLGRAVVLALGDAGVDTGTARLAARLAAPDGGIVVPARIAVRAVTAVPAQRGAPAPVLWSSAEQVGAAAALALCGIDSELCRRTDRSVAAGLAHLAASEDASLLVLTAGPSRSRWEDVLAETPVPALVVFGDPRLRSVDVLDADDPLVHGLAALLARAGVDVHRLPGDATAEQQERWLSRPEASSAVLASRPGPALVRDTSQRTRSLLGVWSPGSSLSAADRAERSLSVVPVTTSPG